MFSATIEMSDLSIVADLILKKRSSIESEVWSTAFRRNVSNSNSAALRRNSKLHTHRVRCLLRRVIKNPIAVIAGDHLFTTTNVGHHLWAQRHVTRHARAVARFGHRDSVTNPRADAFVKRAGRLWQFIYQAFPFRSCSFELLLLGPRLFVKSFEALFHVSAQSLNFWSSFL